MNRQHCILVCLSVAAVLRPAIAAAEDPVEPYPMEYWALREVIDNVQISPDGARLGLMKIPSRDGNPVIEVYDASDLSKEPFRLNADPMEITDFYWVNDADIVFTLRQKVRDRIEGFNQGVYETRLAVVDVTDEKIRSFDETNPFIENLLPYEPDKIILSFMEGGDPEKNKDDPGGKIREAFRPRSYWKFNLETGAKSLLIRGKIALGNIDFDAKGNPWLARGFDLATGEFVWYYREPGGSGWKEIYRQHEDRFDTFNVLDLDPAQDHHVLVAANNDNDKIGLWSFDVHDKKFDELIYRRPDVDVWNVRHHSNEWQHYDEVVGVTYATDRLHTEFFDEVEGATYAQLRELIPYAWVIDITSRSRDGKTMVIYNAGPRDPGTYYLVKDGRVRAVGSKQPLLKSEQLADVEYITYKSRDGLNIAGYITIPHGEPPFPLVVLPHGGPFVGEWVGYDEWAQLLANNGYLVLQPEYRGSRNYGLKFYLSAFIDGGQGGHKMQDDKDDGALYLVKKRLAEPDRIAMFGWSYGGYAALIAASRTPQIYQCVIAGAAVSDPLMQINYYRDRMRGAQANEQLNMWDDSVSPLEEAEKVNVPVLIVHGDVDQRVPTEHSRKYRAALDRYGKNYKYVELKGADHFYDTLFYDHQLKLYESLIGFLKNDCGPGGL
ncbi:MAG TPA: prolyl oligopeptidase family serine peptidase [Woeseiaceae bacterium]|nr:prolyl oligopeptidase family serine peptidase [Woeseiaceae bacterium]